MKIRTEFTKGDNLKFISHLDLMNTITRALRRARIPVQFSQGYNPRPNISFGSALAVGITSSSEYMDFELAEELSVNEFQERLNNELPKGIKIISAAEISDQAKSLMAKINAAHYQINLDLTKAASAATVKEWLADFLATEEIMIVRQRRNKSDREFNLRPMVFELELVESKQDSIVIEALIQTGSSGNLRVEELVRALQQRYPISEEFNLTAVHRLGLYVKEDTKLKTPIEIAVE
ncbi:MAG: TIGR03936 family radical SAM-associated protein [Bacillota bacterium]